MQLHWQEPIDQEVVVNHLLEANSNGQTLFSAYKKLEQCFQRGNEKVFEFKIHLEELFWMLEDVHLTHKDRKICEWFASLPQQEALWQGVQLFCTCS